MGKFQMSETEKWNYLSLSPKGLSGF